MNKTLRISFSLRNAYKVNSILYSLRQLPLIKRLLPASLYGSKGLNRFAAVLAAIWELLSAFLGKYLYFLIMLSLPLNAYQTGAKAEAFLHILLCLSVIGSLFNTYLFNPTKEKYYAVILMRMDARQYALVDYAYNMVKLLVGFLAFGMLFGLAWGVPVWLCLLAPFFVSGLKMIAAVCQLATYEKTGRAVNENNPGKFQWIAAAVLLAAAYGLPALGLLPPLWFAAAVMLAVVLTGAVALKKIVRFQHFRACYQQILHPAVNVQAAAAASRRMQHDRMISADTAVTSRKKGFEYFNELFVKRHRKLLWKSSLRLTGICAAILCVAVAGAFLSPEFGRQAGIFLSEKLPWFVFFMYLINRGTGFTQALFMNCDHSLLTYSFYKRPKFVLKLFRLRLWEIMKVNLLPACTVGLGITALYLACPGRANLLVCAVYAVSIPALSIFFSVHYLTLYYLVQPYNAGTELKSATYQIAMWGTYLVCFFLMNLEIPALAFGITVIAFCLAYCAVSCVLVYKMAPRTFRLRM